MEKIFLRLSTTSQKPLICSQEEIYVRHIKRAFHKPLNILTIIVTGVWAHLLKLRQFWPSIYWEHRLRDFCNIVSVAHCQRRRISTISISKTGTCWIYLLTLLWDMVMMLRVYLQASRCYFPRTRWSCSWRSWSFRLARELGWATCFIWGPRRLEDFQVCEKRSESWSLIIWQLSAQWKWVINCIIAARRDRVLLTLSTRVLITAPLLEGSIEIPGYYELREKVLHAWRKSFADIVSVINCYSTLWFSSRSLNFLIDERLCHKPYWLGICRYVRWRQANFGTFTVAVSFLLMRANAAIDCYFGKATFEHQLLLQAM